MRVVTLEIAGERMGVRLDYVDHLVRLSGGPRAITGAPPTIRGLAETRGRVVTLLDTAALLGHPEEQDRFGAHAAILHEPERGVGLLIPEDVVIEELDDLLLEDDRALDPFVEGVVAHREDPEDRVALLAPSVLVATCRDEVRSRFMTRAIPGASPGDLARPE